MLQEALDPALEGDHSGSQVALHGHLLQAAVAGAPQAVMDHLLGELTLTRANRRFPTPATEPV